MAEKVVNYEDNIFFLNLQVKALGEGLNLDINAGFFVQKITQDIFFYAATIDQLYRKLKGNPHLLGRAEHLKTIQRLKIMFCELLDDILARRVAISQSMGSYMDRLTDVYHACKKDISDIRRMLSKDTADAAESAAIVSEEEFRHLMATDEEED